MRLVITSWIRPCMLLCFAFLFTAATQLNETSMELGALTPTSTGFLNKVNGKSFTIHTNLVQLTPGGVGVIVVSDALKPGQTDVYQDYLTMLTCTQADFQSINLEGRLICNWKKVGCSDLFSNDFSQYPHIILEQKGQGVDALLLVRIPPTSN